MRFSADTQEYNITGTIFLPKNRNESHPIVFVVDPDCLFNAFFEDMYGSGDREEIKETILSDGNNVKRFYESLSDTIKDRLSNRINIRGVPFKAVGLSIDVPGIPNGNYVFLCDMNSKHAFPSLVRGMENVHLVDSESGDIVEKMSYDDEDDDEDNFDFEFEDD